MDDLGALFDARPIAVVVNCVGRTSGTLAQLKAANTDHARNLAVFCLRRGVRLIHLGSAAEYGTANVDLITETTATNPGSDYGRTKLAGTHELLRAADEGLEVVVARPFNILGVGQPPNTPPADFAAAVAALPPGGGTVWVRDSSLVRDFMGLTRVALHLLTLARAPELPRLVNVCSGRGVSFGDLVRALAAARDVEVTVVDTAPGGVPRAVGDPTALHRLVGAQAPEHLLNLARAVLNA